MAGRSHRARLFSVSSSRRRFRLLTPSTLLLGALALLFGTLPGASPVHADNDDLGSACGVPVEPQQANPKHINLVIDDSGSMFFDGSERERLDRWSFAKYSLEAFAALMGPQDSLDVYRMSDFAGAGASRTPELKLSGIQSPAERVQLIHELPLEGGGTPYASVETARADIETNSSDERWLVILTDGEFKNGGAAVPTERVQTELLEFVDSTDAAGNKVGVAFLAIGDEAPEIAQGPRDQIFFRQAATSGDLLAQMGGFANRIFERKSLPLDGSLQWSPDLALEEVIVFAQGAGVDVSGADIAGETRTPDSKVDVSWTDNKQIIWPDGTPIDPLANEDLVGQIATFSDVPRGEITFDIQNAARADVFYKPKVRFGVRLIDEQGNLVTDDKLIAGQYTVEYGFMNDECDIVNSPLLDADNYRARVFQDGQLIADDVARGTQLEFGPGEAIFNVSATYLGGIPATDDIARRFLQPALPSEIDFGTVKLKVSQLDPASGVETRYPGTYRIQDENGRLRPPTAEEWAGLDEDDFIITRNGANWDMRVIKGEVPGDLLLDVQAPGGDVFKASHDNQVVDIEGSHTFDEQVSTARTTVPFEVENDISRWDRILHWLKTEGWKWLLALLLLILLIGYLTKKRFSKRVKRRPSITGTPKSVGVTPIEDRGKFQAGGIKRFLPFVANTATLSYVPPGTVGFRAMKLKAGPGKSMIVTNWKEIAEKDNVEINGTPLNSETKRPPKLSASGTITASTPQMTYELTPSN